MRTFAKTQNGFEAMSISEWHYVEGGTSVGPLSQTDMERLIAQGQVTANTLVWNDTMPQWEPAAIHFAGFRPAGAAAGGAPRGGYPPPGVDPGVIGADGLYVGAPSRDFGEAVSVCLRKYVTFSGRASRSEYWYLVLFSFIIGFVAGFIDALLEMSGSGSGFFNALVSLFVFLPSLAVSVRRLHDIDRTGWWIGFPYLLIVLMVLILTLSPSSLLDSSAMAPFAVTIMLGFVVAMLAYIVLMLVFYCTRGTLGPNRFG